MRLTGKVAIVTGAASGIGAASARMFAAEGARVVVADINDVGGKQTVLEIAAMNGEALFVHADVSRAVDIERLIKTATDQFPRIDILFNVAGIFMKNTAVEDVDELLWDRIYNVNVKSVFMGAKLAVPVMKRSGGGVIINTASMTALGPSRGYSAYASSKGAVITLTKVLAAELAPHNIRVNCIAPKLTDTPMVKDQMDEIRRIPRTSSDPMARPATPDEIAGAALFLASDEAAMVSGICLEVSGGQIV
jgi:NAD(P)-dependent dehydrogenase (short-subunit alcohol dehydrogenase family)